MAAGIQWITSLLTSSKTDENDITDEVLESDFIPYVCHFDPQTLVTKNGETLQILHIPQFGWDGGEIGLGDIRQALRDALLTQFHNTDYGFWFHLIRRPADLLPIDPAARNELQDARHSWKKAHQFGKQFRNDLYISIVREGQNGKIKTPQDFLRGSVGFLERRYRESYLEQSMARIHQDVDKLCQSLSGFGCRKLGVVERDGIFYSEMLEFLGYLINLEEAPFPLADIDFSEYLTTHEIAFSFNTMETQSPARTSRYGTILSMKEHADLNHLTLDQIMNAPFAFVFSEAFHYVPDDDRLKRFEDYKDTIRLSGDAEIANISGLNAMLAKPKAAFAYGVRQQSLFLAESTPEKLEQLTLRMLNMLNRMGLVMVREDLRMEECFWAMLPANFIFLHRTTLINSAWLGETAHLSTVPAGKERPLPWGKPLTVFPTLMETPYHFSFQVDGKGHGMIFGSEDAPAAPLIAFLLSEARHQGIRAIQILTEPAKGKAIAPSKAQPVAMNPFSLPLTPEREEFLTLWLGSLLAASGHALAAEDKDHLKQAVVALYKQGARSLKQLIQTLEPIQPQLAAGLKDWVGGGAHHWLFDHELDGLEFHSNHVKLDLSALMGDGAFIPVLLYFLHRLQETLGAPTIVLFQDAWLLLENPVLGPRIASWCDALTKQRALAIFATDDPAFAMESRLITAVSPKIASKIFLPNEEVGEHWKEPLGLSDELLVLLGMLPDNPGHFFLLRGKEYVTLNYKGLPEL